MNLHYSLKRALAHSPLSERIRHKFRKSEVLHQKFEKSASEDPLVRKMSALDRHPSPTANVFNGQPLIKNDVQAY